MIISMPRRLGPKVPAKIRRSKAWRDRPVATVVQLLESVIDSGYRVRTSYDARFSGVSVPDSARTQPILEWGCDGDYAWVVNGNICSELRFRGVRELCVVPVGAVRKWAVRGEP